MNTITTVYTFSPTETEQFGAELAKKMMETDSLPPFIALYGDLGVGKTAFVRGFASVFSPNAAVRSPTFTLVNEYRSTLKPLFHFDMYRIDSEDDLLSIGFYDYEERGGICLVEWSEKIPFALPDEYLKVTILKNDPQQADSRKITVEQIGENGQ